MGADHWFDPTGFEPLVLCESVNGGSRASLEDGGVVICIVTWGHFAACDHERLSWSGHILQHFGDDARFIRFECSLIEYGYLLPVRGAHEENSLAK